MRRVAAAVILSVALEGAAGSYAPAKGAPTQAPTLPPEWITWDEAKARGLLPNEPGTPPPGVSYCTRAELHLDYQGLPAGKVPPADGPVCFARPRDLGTMVPADPSVGDEFQRAAAIDP